MQCSDALTLDAPKRTDEGYVIVRARAARTGVYQYTGREVDPTNAHGLRDKAIVNVLRDEHTVFDTAAAKSFIGKPVTDDHPSVAVNSANWRDYARGTVMGALRDGEYLAFDILLTDKATVDKVDAGKRELSNGYGAELEFGSFKAADGTFCDARQSKITGGNHVALVDRGRAGSECAIKDGFAVCDAITADKLSELKASLTTDGRNGTMPHTLMVDGLQVPNVSDEAKACIEKLQGQLRDGATSLADKDKQIGTLTGEKAALEQKVKDADTANEPAALDKRVADRSALISQAKAIVPNVTTDGQTDAQIRKAVVSAKLGDAASTMNDDAIGGAFALLAKDAKPASQTVQSLGSPAPTFTDNAAVRDLARAMQY